MNFTHTHILSNQEYIEKISNEWRTELIIPVPKKGAMMNCSNYPGITLFNVTYNTLTTIIKEGTQNLTENV